MEQKWICDNCGGVIENIDDGCLEWMAARQGEAFKIMKPQIVHRVKCLYNQERLLKDYNAILEDISLRYLLGYDGLMELLSLVSDADKENQEDFIRIIKRLHIPNYEESFRYFKSALNNFVFEPTTKPDYYSQQDMKAVIEWKNKIEK